MQQHNRKNGSATVDRADGTIQEATITKRRSETDTRIDSYTHPANE